MYYLAMGKFENKKIWLIGASTGIGAALAVKLAEAGAILQLSARGEETLTALCNRLPGNGHTVISLDVTDIASMQQAHAACWPYDVVIYNAGAYEPAPVQEVSLDAAMQVMDVNLHGAMRLLDVMLPDMVKTQAGHIVLVGSIAGWKGLPNAYSYGVSKAGVNHLAEQLKLDLAPYDITVQLVSPGFVKTQLTDKNSFAMPAMISPEKAAEYIIKGLQKPNRFEIHFPKRFSWSMKLLTRVLPHRLYFWLVGKI